MRRRPTSCGPPTRSCGRARPGTGPSIAWGYRTRHRTRSLRSSPNRQPNGWRNNHRDFIYNNWHDHHWHNNGWWARNYWNYHPHPHYAFGDYNWWAWATWPSLTNWVGFASTPVYYNYGQNVYYDGDSVYYGDQQYASAADYAAQAEQIQPEAAFAAWLTFLAMLLSLGAAIAGALFGRNRAIEAVTAGP